MIYTTLNEIHDAKPCYSGWKKLLAHLGKRWPDDEPLPLGVILESNGLSDTIWCLCQLPDHRAAAITFTDWCVQRLQRYGEHPRLVDAHALTNAAASAAYSGVPDRFWAAVMCAADAAAAEAAETAETAETAWAKERLAQKNELLGLIS